MSVLLVHYGGGLLQQEGFILIIQILVDLQDLNPPLELPQRGDQLCPLREHVLNDGGHGLGQSGTGDGHDEL